MNKNKNTITILPFSKPVNTTVNPPTGAIATITKVKNYDDQTEEFQQLKRNPGQKGFNSMFNMSAFTAEKEKAGVKSQQVFVKRDAKQQ